MKRCRLSDLVTACWVMVAFIMMPSCGTPSGRGSTIGKQASQVAREGRSSGGQKYYQLGPQFEEKLDQMVGQEIMALAGHREDMPLELNQDVLVNLRYFLNDARGFMTRSLSRGQKYIPMMKAILRQKGLPEDLVYMALIESGFKTEAVSHASAVGPWQFIAATGRRYGLVIDEYVDERMDPVKSTYAAADYLTALHDMFNSWPLAIAAYNTGEAKIMRGMKDPNTADYWDMAKRDGFLANETKRYVPAFLAAAIISKDPEAYGLEIESSPPDAWEDVIVPAPMALSVAADLSGSSLERIKELNPHLKRNATPANETNFVLRVPEGTRANFYRQYAQLPESKRGGGLITYTARRGESIDQVASRHGLTPSVVRQYNGIPDGTRLASGQTLVLPTTMPPEVPSATVVAAAQRETPRRRGYRPSVVVVTEEPVAVAQAPPPQPEPTPAPTAQPSAPPPMPVAVASSQTRRSQVINSISHRVRAGDTILGIARLYGVKADQIKSDNRLASNAIREGQILNIRSNLPLTASSETPRSSRNTWVQVSEGVPATHTVKAGETVSTIAANYKVSQRQLRDLNELSGDTIKVGQKLKIGTVPAPKSTVTGGEDYKVVAGDTVSGIADRYGLTSEELRQINNLSGNDLKIGQVLRVPAIRTASARASTATKESQGKESETATEIAGRLGVREENIQKLNDISDDLAKVGQTIKVAAGGTVEREYVVATGDSMSVIAERHGMKTDQLRQLNGLEGDDIRVGQKLKVLDGRPEAQAQARAQASAAESGQRTGQSADGAAGRGTGRQGGDNSTYVVQSGDTVSQIAERHGMRSDALRQLNNLPNDNIRPGQKLAVSAGGADESTQARSSESQARPTQTAQAAAQPAAQPARTAASAIKANDTYVVQNGDTVSQIAERHGMRTADLRTVNNLNDDNIRVGQRLFVASGGGGSSSQAQRPAQSSQAQRPAQSSQAQSSQAPRIAGGDTYVVQSGDTVSQIAERHGMRADALRALNNLPNDNIRPGQKLSVKGGRITQASATSPARASSGGTYTVVPGDTMYSIATRHKLSVDKLKALNGKENDILRPGETLKVN
ncbi:MAG: LysM peptidoglycan-binding domain-containing protein [Deltaproteobacteria bacterium]|jgi:membrane-bound lytic murein transglycosylase D|nr:LysM peptidoglycan-binding domain-containing protein [Deltaproteobacteria bacterium]